MSMGQNLSFDRGQPLIPSISRRAGQNYIPPQKKVMPQPKNKSIEACPASHSGNSPSSGLENVEGAPEIQGESPWRKTWV